MSGHDLAQGPLDPLLFFGLKFLDLNQTPEVVVGGDGIEPPTSTELAEHDPSR